MFRFKSYIGSKKGSLVLSLVAAGTVAATIVATHQVAQRFASGAVGAFNQQQAFILAQKSLAVAGLMVNRNIVLCSNMPTALGSGRVLGCDRKGPLASDVQAKKFYDSTNSLKLNDSYFAVVSAETAAYGEKYLIFKHPIGKHHIFKNAEITWALRSLKDTNLRSISGSLSKGYTCRDRDTSDVIEEGYCPSFDDDRSDKEKLLSNRDSNLLKEPKCRTGDTNNNGKIDENDTVFPGGNSVCDYYADSDGDQAIVFISVKVPYQNTDAEEEEKKYLVVNAAIRRPMSIVKTHIEEDSSMCPISCALASRSSHMGTSNVDHPDCVGFVSGTQSGGKYFQDDIYTVETKMKVKNYGPGVLYGMQLLKEDVDPRTGLLLGKSMIGFPNSDPASHDPLEPVHLTIQDGERDISHITPCYSANFYSPSLQSVTCDCESSADAVNTAGGVICKKDKSICTGKSIFASNVPSVLEGAEAREILSCPNKYYHQTSGGTQTPAVSNSMLTAFEQPCESASVDPLVDDCEYTRIDSDQVPPGSGETWCGNAYASTVTGREERPNAPITTVHNAEETVFPMANQDNIPLSVTQP